mgnify:CR=1 FL=1
MNFFSIIFQVAQKFTQKVLISRLIKESTPVSSELFHFLCPNGALPITTRRPNESVPDLSVSVASDLVNVISDSLSIKAMEIQ